MFGLTKCGIVLTEKKKRKKKRSKSLGNPVVTCVLKGNGFHSTDFKITEAPAVILSECKANHVVCFKAKEMFLHPEICEGQE